MPFRRTARKVINKTSDALSAPARMRSRRKVAKSKAQVNILKNDIDNRRPGNWTGSPTQRRTRNSAIALRKKYGRK